MEERARELLKGVTAFHIKDREIYIYENAIHALPFLEASINGWNTYYPNQTWKIVYYKDRDTPISGSVRKIDFQL